MIDRKLLKANRWEDEEYLHARRTNALYNGGGGGRGGGGGVPRRHHDNTFQKQKQNGHGGPPSAYWAATCAGECERGNLIALPNV